MQPSLPGPANRPSSSAIVISEDLEITANLRAGLEKIVARVTTVPAVEVVPEDPPANVVVFHVMGEVNDEAIGSIQRVPHKCPVIVALSGNNLSDVAAALRASDRVAGVLTEDRATPECIAELAGRVLRGKIFGLDRQVSSDAAIHSVEIASYEDKLRCIEEILHYAKSKRIRGKYRDAIAQCVDEMLMNALYEAPREASMGSLSALEFDKASIAARAKQPVLVQYAYDDGMLFLSVRDSYGSLRRDALLEHWRHAIDSQRDGDDALEGGLGLYIMSHSSTRLQFNEIPGVATECIGAFDVRAPKLQVKELDLLHETDRHSIAALTAAKQPEFDDVPLEDVRLAGPSKSVIALLVGLVVIALVLLVLVLLSRT